MQQPGNSTLPFGLGKVKRTSLCVTPTPIHRWRAPGIPEDVELYIKRDDCTGFECSGNKIRKLEFLLAEAVASGADCIVTIGGTQSNHCRATVLACRRLGLQPYVILRDDQDPEHATRPLDASADSSNFAGA